MPGTICYWRGSAEVREDILHALTESGYKISPARTLEDVLDGLRKNPPLTIIVDGSAGQREASDRIVELSNTEVIQNFPIVFISPQASKRVAVLKARYPRLFAIDLPYHLHQVMRGIQLLIRSGEVEQPQEFIPESKRTPSGSFLTPASSAAVIVDEDPLVLAAEAAGTTRIRQRRISNLDPSKLIDTYGGDVLAFATHPDDFNDAALIPHRANSAQIGSLLDQMTAGDSAGAVHARRVAFVSSAIATKLAFSKEREENVRLAGMFLNLAFHQAGAPHMHLDLFRDGDDDAVKQLSEGFIESARLVSSALGDARAARAIQTAGQYLQKTIVVSPEDAHIIEEAKCALIVELSDRSCWSLGFWNPYGAYRSMRNLNGATPLVDDAKLAGAIGRVLGEAVTSNVTIGNYYVPRQRPPSPPPESDPLEALSGSYQAHTVSLIDLAPGMRLAQPVRALDGRLVLNADVKLDQALLVQLWQLAAVRALNSKVAVHADN